MCAHLPDEKIEIYRSFSDLLNQACHSLGFVFSLFNLGSMPQGGSGLQTNTDYRFRVCACRRCLDTSQELSGAFSPSAAFVLQRSEVMLTGDMGSLDDPKMKSMMPTDEQFAALIVVGFATLSILFAFILQYFLMK